MEGRTIRGLLILLLVIVIVVSGMWYLHKQDAPKRAAYDSLARCLSDNGAIFYGAYWCPNCSQQKTAFGSAGKTLPYVECSTRDRSGQAPACEEQQIRSYPTWTFASGMRCTGVVDARILAHLSGCSAPNPDGIEWTPQTLYEDIVLKPLRDRLVHQQTSDGEVENIIQDVTSQVDSVLTGKYGTTVATEQDMGNMLDVISAIVSQCQIVLVGGGSEEAVE